MTAADSPSHLPHAAAPSDGKLYDVVVLGSFVYDLVAYSPRLPHPGESLVGDSFVSGFGGKGCNQAVMSHILGSKTAMLGCLGQDTFGREYRQHLEAEGLTTVVTTAPQGVSTGVAFITVTKDGQNQIVVVFGANNHLKSEDVTDPSSPMHQAIVGARVLVCQLEVPLEVVEAGLQLGKKSGAVTILNPAPMPAQPECVGDRLMSLADIACPNEVEAALWTGEEGKSVQEVAESCITRLLGMGCSRPMVTLGAHGVLVCDADQRRHLLPAPRVSAVDTTGAGDCFVGSLAHFVAASVRRGASGLGSEELLGAVRRAVALASLSVTRGGTQTSFPRGEEVAAAIGRVEEEETRTQK